MSQTVESKIVGRVAGLYRFPVKSMAGETLQEAKVRWTGIEGDRRYAFVRADSGKLAQIDFPWFTGREYPALVTYQAAHQEEYKDGAVDVRVTVPDGRTFPIDSDALQAHLSEASGKSAALLRLGRSTYDGMPLSLLSTTSIADVARASGVDDHSPLRYRPNILVELEPDTHEDRWIGFALAIGDDLKIWVTGGDPRCMMINLDPRTGQQQAQILRHVAQQRDNNLGVYATVIAPGRVRVGDEIRVAAVAVPQ